MNSKNPTQKLTRSELVSKRESLEEQRQAIVHKMAEKDLPAESDSFRALVTQKQDITIEIERINSTIRNMDAVESANTNPINQGISFEL